MNSAVARRDPRHEHLGAFDHRARRGHAASAARRSACISSIRCTRCSSWKWSSRRETAPGSRRARAAIRAGDRQAAGAREGQPRLPREPHPAALLIEAGRAFRARRRASRRSIEAMLDFGMPMGPLRLIDEVGVDVGADVAATLAAAFPSGCACRRCLPKMIEHGLLGTKERAKAFTGTKKARRPKSNPELRTLRPQRRPGAGTREELEQRMVLLMVNEAARCLEEEIVEAPGDIDFAMVMGTGFAPFRGGPLRYADTLGARRKSSMTSRGSRKPPARTSRPAPLLARDGRNRQNAFMKTEPLPQRLRRRRRPSSTPRRCRPSSGRRWN